MTTNYGGDRVASATQHSRRLEQALEPDSIDASPARAQIEATKGSNGLRRLLVLLDATAVALAWAIALTVPDGLDPPGISRLPNLLFAIALITLVAVVFIASQRLYLARVCSVRAVETVRLGRTAALTALLLQAGERHLRIDV